MIEEYLEPLVADRFRNEEKYRVGHIRVVNPLPGKPRTMSVWEWPGAWLRLWPNSRTTREPISDTPACRKMSSACMYAKPANHSGRAVFPLSDRTGAAALN